MPEILTDEQAAAIWSGQTTSLLGLEPEKKVDTPPPPVTKQEEPPKEPVTTVVKDEDLANVFHEDEEEEVEEQETPPATPANAPPAEKKPGRKASDLVTGVNQMIEEGLLLAADDGQGGIVEIKTIEDAKKLIKSNLEHRQEQDEEQWWESKKKAYSPQVQAVLHYADQGAQSASEVIELLGAIREVEEAAEIDIKTPAGAEKAVRETYRSKGFKDAYIDKQINILKDLGGSRLQEEAADLYPELLASKQALVEKSMTEKEQRRQEAEEASKVYVSTIRKTLDKDVIGAVKLTREDKAKLYEAITLPKYQSLNGSKTNLFVKTLEELQFGNNANYDHYMNVVQFAIDPQGFIDKLKTSVTNTVTEETFKKLKTAKATSATTNNDDANNRTQVGRTNKTLPSKGFVNPYS